MKPFEMANAPVLGSVVVLIAAESKHRNGGNNIYTLELIL